MKQKYEFKDIVAETLLIPLYMRAKESRRDNPILYDKAAELLANSLEYDYSQFDGAKLSEVGCVVRGWYFDRAVQRFIKMWDVDWIPVSSVSEVRKQSFMIWICLRSLLYAGV